MTVDREHGISEGEHERDTIARLHVYVEFADPDSRAYPRGKLYHWVDESRSLIEAQLRASVAEHLGPEFDVRVALRYTSVEVLASIILVGSAVMTYGALRRG